MVKQNGKMKSEGFRFESILRMLTALTMFFLKITKLASPSGSLKNDIIPLSRLSLKYRN